MNATSISNDKTQLLNCDDHSLNSKALNRLLKQKNQLLIPACRLLSACH